MYFRTLRTPQINNKGKKKTKNKITAVVLNFKKRIYMKMRDFVKKKIKKVGKTIKS